MPDVYNKRDETTLIPSTAKYVGRGSKWGNPYHVGRDGDRDDVLRKYMKHLLKSGLYFDLDELQGKDLVCYCAPLPCHAVLLMHLANRVPYESAAQSDMCEVRDGTRLHGSVVDVHVGERRMPELRGRDLGLPRL